MKAIEKLNTAILTIQDSYSEFSKWIVKMPVAITNKR